MMPRFPPMVRKEFIQMRRDRLTLAIMVGLPVAQLLLFGFAIQTDVRHLPTVVLDQSRTPPSRDLIAAFENTGNFRIIGYVDDRPALDRAIDRGDAQAGIVVPYDFPRRLVRGTTARVQVIVDAADPLSSQAAIAAAAGVTQSRNLAILSRAAGREEVPLEARVRPRYNPGLRSPNYIVLGRVVFEVPLSGNVLLLYAIALLFVIASLSFGLFISTLVRTQQQAMQVAFFFVLPNILLSGFMFPRQAMPPLFQWLGLLLPLTHFLKVLRGILLKGVGLEALWREVAVLTGFAVVMIAASVRRFHKTLD